MNEIICKICMQSVSSRIFKKHLEQHLTKKKNHSFKVSKTEDLCYAQLLSIYPDAKHGYKSTKYPFVCDLYIPSKDIYIELNFHWTHGLHPYNKKMIVKVSRLDRKI